MTMLVVDTHLHVPIGKAWVRVKALGHRSVVGHEKAQAL